MNNQNYAPGNIQPSSTDSAKESAILAETYSKMKAEIKDEAQQIFAPHHGNISKPNTLAETCSKMKLEIKDEAKRLAPDLGNQH